MSKHQFAFYFPEISNFNNQQSFLITDQTLYHRIINVLKFKITDEFILFSQRHYVVCQIKDISKKHIIVYFLTSIVKNIKDKQEVVFLLPLLKKEALEQAVYSLAEIGVSKIQLIITQKSRQKFQSLKEFDRLQAQVIAAAEQSKHFYFPELLQPIDLETLVKFDFKDSCKFLFDSSGCSFFELRKDITTDKTVFLMLGPEGGLDDIEILSLKEQQFVLCVLTTTVLRAVQAVALGAGIFRLK